MNNSLGIEFLDRVDERKDFKKKYNTFKDKINEDNKSKLILNYYGHGGVGKSELMQEIKKELRRNNKGCLVIRYDLEAFSSVSRALFNLKQLLVSECGFEFPEMDLAQYVYEYINGNNPLFPKSQPSIDKKARSRICFELFGELPVIGFLFKSVKMWDEVYAIMKDENNRMQLAQLKDSAPLDLEENLRDLFIEELNANLRKVKEPLVIMLDRFEKLSKKRDANIDYPDADRWICGYSGLIKRVPKVLWVITGREELSWKEKDKTLNSFLDTFKLKPLDEGFTFKFLEEGGVPKKFHEHLYKTTKGIPQYLKLCVETARYTDEDELTIEHFGNNEEELIERFTDHLFDNQIKVLTMLSCIEDWNDEMVAEVGPKSLKSFDNPTYRRIKKISFINYDGRKYWIDQVIRESLLLKLTRDDFDLLYNTLKNTMEYLSKKVNRNESGSIYEKVEHALQVYIDKEEDINKIKDFYVKYIKDVLFDISKMGIKTDTNVIFHKFYSRASQSEDKIFKIYALYSHSFFLKNAGKYSDACKVGKQAFDSCKDILNEDDPLRLEVESNYTECLWKEGGIKQSIELDRDMLTKREEKLGPQNINTLRTKNNLAAGYSCLGQYDEALKLGQEVLEKQEKLLGADDPDTLRTKNNLAVYLSSLGKDVEALKLGEEVYYSLKEKLGEDHPDTLRALSNLACFKAVLGKYEEAVKLDRTVLDKREKVLGTDHPDTLLSKNNLAVHLAKYERLGNVIELDREVLAARKKTFGVNHEDTIRAIRNLACDLSNYGGGEEWSEALKLFREVFARTKKKFGANHPNTLRALRDLAMGVFNLSQEADFGEEAVKLHREVLVRTNKMFGKYHPDTLEDMARLALVLNFHGDPDESVQLYKEVIARREKVLGPDHPDTLQAIKELYKYTNIDDEEASEWEREVLIRLNNALTKCRKELGEDDPETIQAMRNLAEGLTDSYYHEDYEKAIKLDREVLAKCEKLLGRDDPDTIQAMRKLADDLSSGLKKYDEAVKLEKEVLAWCRKTLGEKDSETLKAMEALAYELCKLVRNMKADKNTLDKPDEVTGESLLDTLQFMRELAADFKNMFQYNDAWLLEDEVLDMRRKVLGENHADTLQSKKAADALADFVKLMETNSEEKKQID